MTKSAAVISLSMLAALTGLPGAGGAQGANATRGEDLAVKHCARCHVVPGRNNMGIGSTPSFKIMVQSKAADWRDKFEAFYSLPPHPGFVFVEGYPRLNDLPSAAAPIELTFEDVDDLVSYVDRLAEKFRK